MLRTTKLSSIVMLWKNTTYIHIHIKWSNIPTIKCNQTIKCWNLGNEIYSCVVDVVVLLLLLSLFLLVQAPSMFYFDSKQTYE